MKKIKLRELSPIVISVTILSIFLVGLTSAAVNGNGKIGDLFFKTLGGYKLYGINVLPTFGTQNIITTGLIKAGGGKLSGTLNMNNNIITAAKSISSIGTIYSAADIQADGNIHTLAKISNPNFTAYSNTLGGINVNGPIQGNRNISSNGGIINNHTFVAYKNKGDGIMIHGGIKLNGPGIRQITGVASPTQGDSAANKNYVDKAISDAISLIPATVSVPVPAAAAISTIPQYFASKSITSYRIPSNPNLGSVDTGVASKNNGIWSIQITCNPPVGAQSISCTKSGNGTYITCNSGPGTGCFNVTSTILNANSISPILKVCGGQANKCNQINF